MAMLKLERPPSRSAVCSECGHELYPLYSAIGEHPTWECRSPHCRVAVCDEPGAQPHVCGCAGAPHQEV